MISLLTTTLDSIERVQLDVTELSLPELARYRAAAFRLMRALSAPEVVDQTSEERLLIGRHVSGTLRLPADWNEEWLRQLVGECPPDEFARRLGDTSGTDELATSFVEAAQQLITATGGSNPMRERCRHLLAELGGSDYRILLRHPHAVCRQLYTTLAPSLGDGVLCRESDLRRMNTIVDTLVTTGRFDRFTPDHILTAPRWKTIANIRWAGDADDREDFPLFPSLGPAPGSTPVGNSPVRPPVEVRRTARSVACATPSVSRTGTGENATEDGGTVWDAITFDEWYLGRRRRLAGRTQVAPARTSGYSGLAVYVGTCDGGGVFVPINEDGRARAVLAFDPWDNTVAMRRPVTSGDPECDRADHLREGMMLVLPGEVVDSPDSPGPRFRPGTSAERLALKTRWKRALAERIDGDRLAEAVRRLGPRGLGISLDLRSRLPCWASEEGINAPRSEEHFRLLVRDFLCIADTDSNQEQQYPWWRRAWDAVCYERGLNISLGLLEENHRERLLKDAILAHIPQLEEAARRASAVTLTVEGSEGQMRLAPIELIEEENEGKRFHIPEHDCLTYLESHEERHHWLK